MGENQFVMVSEWMRNGNINEFILSHKDVDRFKLVSLRSCHRPRPFAENLPGSSKMSLGGWYIHTIKEWYMVT